MDSPREHCRCIALAGSQLAPFHGLRESRGKETADGVREDLEWLLEVALRSAKPISECQTAIHFAPEQLSTFSCHCKGAVVEITGEVAQGVADASPILW